MANPDPNKYVASTRPVNRRTAPATAPRINPIVHERLDAARARNQMGASLQGQLSSVGKRAALDTPMIACAITLTIATITLFLAWLQSSLPLILISLAGFAGAAALFAWRKRRGGSSGWHEPEEGLPAGLDEESVRQLDEVLDRLQVEAPEDLMAQLKSLKTLLVRIGQQMRGPPDEHFTMDDGMYVRECVRRYLPDSAAGYLRVPKGQRSTSLERDGQTAESLLRSQLNLIESELQKRETKLARSAAEHLLRQQRFLEGKASR